MISTIFLSVFFVGSTTEEATFEVTIAQIIEAFINVDITPQQKHSKKLQQMEAVTLLLQLTKSSAKLHATKERARKAQLQDVSVETFQNVSKHLKEL